jgi:predicted Zn finger-like uncharacterized protein
MDHRVTQCPRCGTSFRVTEAHLAVAAGAVRCGSCLHIFNALEHWVDKPAPTPGAAAQQTDSAPPPAAADASDDDLLIDDDTPLFEDDDEEKAATGIFGADEESFTEPGKADGDELSDPFLELNSWEEEQASLFSEPDTVEDDADSEEQWTRRLLEDDEENAIQAPARAPIFEDYGDMSEPPAAGDAAAEDEPAEEFLDIPDARPFAHQAPPSEPAEPGPTPEIESIDYGIGPLRADPGERIGNNAGGAARPLLDTFEPEPLQLHQHVRASRWPALWWGLGLAAVLLLALGQYLYFNFDTLARGELRPWLARTCAALGCALPTRSDIARIHTSSLIVRSHPTERGALAVDAIITNQAPFAQPYPQLLLQFTDLNGAPVAGRRFKPEEYLGGELTGSRLMPVQQPVHIALELVDPGPRAVNYQLTVVPSPAPGADQKSP